VSRATGRLRGLAWLALALVVGACGEEARGAPSPALAEHAAPLVAAHEALEAHAERVDADPDAATTAWPAIEDEVSGALETLPDPETLDLEARERSALVGYSRGLEVAVAAWGDVHAALVRGDEAAARQAADGARERMRHLERLRIGVTP
jgi:hypothetical protein